MAGKNFILRATDELMQSVVDESFDVGDAKPRPTAVVIGFHTSRTMHNIIERCMKKAQYTYIRTSSKVELVSALREYNEIALFSADYETTSEIFHLALSLGKMAHDNKIPIVYIGSHIRKEDMLIIFRAGGNHVIRRPFDERVFYDKVHNILKPVDFKEIGIPKIVPIRFKEDATPAEKAATLPEEVNSILALPHAVNKILTICRDPNVSNSALIPLINSDPSVCSAVIRRANSAYYFGNKKITKITDALVRLGIKELRNIVSLMSVFKMFDTTEKTFGFNRFLYWQHALGTALVAEHLAEISGDEKISADAFLAGLMHDIGKIIFDDYLRSDYEPVLQEAASGPYDLSGQERHLFMTDHATLGSQLCINWKLPEEVCMVIHSHHSLVDVFEMSDKSEHARISKYVYMANSIVKLIGIGHSGNFLINEIPANEWPQILTGPKATLKFYRDIYNSMFEFMSLLKIPEKELRFPDLTHEKPIQQVVVGNGNLSELIRFYCVLHGHKVTIAVRKEIFADKTSDLRIIDGRMFDGEDLIELIERSDTSETPLIILHDKQIEGLPHYVDVIAPAQDLFQLDMIFKT